MIKASVLYPNTAGAKFDHTYYRDSHMPMIKKLMGEYCLQYAIDIGLSGDGPNTPAPYIAMGHIYCESMEAFQAGMGPHNAEIMADLQNYTDIKPVLQFSEVIGN